MIIQGEDRNAWKFGIVIDLILGKNGVLPGAKVKTTDSNFTRAIQHLHPLELSCDESQFEPVFQPRESRGMQRRIQNLAEDEEE